MLHKWKKILKLCAFILVVLVTLNLGLKSYYYPDKLISKVLKKISSARKRLVEDCEGELCKRQGSTTAKITKVSSLNEKSLLWDHNLPSKSKIEESQHHNEKMKKTMNYQENNEPPVDKTNYIDKNWSEHSKASKDENWSEHLKASKDVNRFEHSKGSTGDTWTENSKANKDKHWSEHAKVRANDNWPEHSMVSTDDNWSEHSSAIKHDNWSEHVMASKDDKFDTTHRKNKYQEHKSLHDKFDALKVTQDKGISSVNQNRETNFERRHDSRIQRRKRKSVCWKHDIATWTLRQIRPNCKRVTMRKLRKYKIKRIIHFDGQITYPVCNKKTKRCKEQPRYSSRLKRMIERPPCCISHVLRLFAHLTSELDMMKVSYYLVAGGLVGWVKNKSMPRYEDDLDIHIHEKYWNTSNFRDTLDAIENKYKHHVRRFKGLPNFIRIFYSQMNTVHVDMWPFKIEKSKLGKRVKTMSTLTWSTYPHQTIFPLQSTYFSGIKTWVPARPDRWLDDHYKGRFSWREEVFCKKKRRKKCIM